VLKIFIYLQTKSRRHITNTTPVKWMKEDGDIIMGGRPAYCEVFTSSSEVAGIWLFVGTWLAHFDRSLPTWQTVLMKALIVNRRQGKIHFRCQFLRTL